MPLVRGLFQQLFITIIKQLTVFSGQNMAEYLLFLTTEHLLGIIFLSAVRRTPHAAYAGTYPQDRTPPPYIRPDRGASRPLP